MRASLTAGLCALILTPVPVLGWLGMRGIEFLEGEELRLRGEESGRALARDLAAALRALVMDQAAADGLCFTSPWLAVDGAGLGVALEPAGQEFADPRVLRAREQRSAGHDVEALEALDTMLLPSAAAPQRAVASVEAASILIELGRHRQAGALLERARGHLQGASDPARRERWLRWLELRSTHLMALPGSPGTTGVALDRALEEWWAEVEARATSIEELVQLHDLARLGAGGDSDSFLPRIERRRRYEAWAAGIAGRDRPDSQELRLTSAGGRWFVVADQNGARRFRSVEDVNEWLERWRGQSGARLRSSDTGHDSAEVGLPAELAGPGVDLDLSAVRCVIRLADSSQFGPVDPRWVLGVGLVLYVAVGLALVRAIRVQGHRSQQLLRTREDLIAQILHELRTPLTVLRMYSESLLQGRVPEDSRDQYLRTIDQESRRLGDLIDRVAEMAREESAGGVAATAVIPPGPVVEQVVKHYHEVVSQDGGDAVLSRNDPCTLLASEEDLRRILEVLLDNAVAYGPVPVHLKVSSETDLERRSGPSVVVVRVQDNGPGVAEADRVHLFERFFRGEAGRRSGRRGAGMGLALARQTAERLGGTLELTFPVEGGTTAVLTLPAASQDASP